MNGFEEIVRTTIRNREPMFWPCVYMDEAQKERMVQYSIFAADTVKLRKGSTVQIIDAIANEMKKFEQERWGSFVE